MKELIGPIRERAVNLEQRSGNPGGGPASNGYYTAEAYIADGPRLQDCWKSVRRHLPLVIGLTLLITSGVAVYMAFKPDVYQADAQVQVNLENINPQLGGVKGGSLIVSPVTDPAYFNTQLQLLVRPWLLRRVVKTLDIENHTAFQAEQHRTGSTWGNLLTRLGVKRAKEPAIADLGQERSGQGKASVEELAEATRLAPYVEMIQASLTVEPVKETRLPIKDTRLINISFSHPDPLIAARIVNTLADTFVLSNLENKNDVNSMTRDILHKRVTELQTQIRNGEDQLMNYAKSNEILSLDPGQNTVVERLTGLNRQLLEVENERKLAEAAYRAALKPGAAAALAEGTTKVEPETENRLAELKQRRAQLLVETTEEWPEVKELDQQIASLEKHLGNTRERATSVMLTNLETKYRQALARENALRSSFNHQRGETLKQNQAAITYRMMQQELETSKNLLEGLFQRQKENDGMLAGMINNIRVTDYAVTPKTPVGPRRLLLTGVALVLALGLSLGLAVLIDYTDNTVRSVEDVDQTLHARTLASIPSITGLKRNRLLQLSSGLRQRNGGSVDREVFLDDSQSWLTEIYRQLRTSMLLSGAPGTLQTILVTSSMPGEGKTTAAINTALSLARTRARVLLIDADTRNPRVHKQFGLENEDGLSSILARANAQPDLLSWIEQDRASGLWVLTAGPPDPNFTELLGSDRIRQLLKELGIFFEYIVIDSPPVAHFADGVLLAQMVDGVLLVVNSGKTRREVVRQSQQLLRDVGANIIGVVLNNVKVPPFEYGYYYNYYSNGVKDTNGKTRNGTRISERDSYPLAGPLSVDQRVAPDKTRSAENVSSATS
jgi:succinoglycan biosynthesis transport protein ExoP